MKKVKKLTDKQIAGIALNFKLKYKLIFLKLNKLKVGDKVLAEFSFQRLVTDRRGKGTGTATFQSEAIGTLKEDEQGCLYIESDEEFVFYKLQTFYKRNKINEGYASYKKKSIIKLGPTTWIS